MLSHLFQSYNYIKWDYPLEGNPPLAGYEFPQFIVLDGFETSKEYVDGVRAKSPETVIIAYFSIGTYENWRPDKNDFPQSIIGKAMEDWAGESWLDIRQWDIIQNIAQNRINIAKNKGFQGIDFDNVDGWDNKTGFKLTKQDQLNFNRNFAEMIRRNGMLAGLKNDGDQVEQLAMYFDFSICEECFKYKEPESYQAFIDQGKPVFNVEYCIKKSKDVLQKSHKQTDGKFNTIVKNEKLDYKFKQDYTHVGIAQERTNYHGTAQETNNGMAHNFCKV